MTIPPRWTVSAPPIVHKTTMNVAAERTAVIIPVTKSTGDWSQSGRRRLSRLLKKPPDKGSRI